MSSVTRFVGGERVVIRDIGLRTDPAGESIAEFDGRVGTVTGIWAGFVAVSLDDGPMVNFRPAELDDYVPTAPPRDNGDAQVVDPGPAPKQRER
jgi:hypothetical protein